MEHNVQTVHAPIGVDESVIAQQISLSVSWLRKDRRTKRIIPFFRVGDLVRYNPETVAAAMRARNEGGAAA